MLKAIHPKGINSEERERERVLDLIGFYSRSKVCKAEKQS